MFCSRCGKPLQEGARHCGYCGAPVGWQMPPERKYTAASAPSDAMRRNQKKKTGWLIGAALVVCLLVGFAAAWLILSNRTQPVTEQPAAQSGLTKPQIGQAPEQDSTPQEETAPQAPAEAYAAYAAYLSENAAGLQQYEDFLRQSRGSDTYAGQICLLDLTGDGVEELIAFVPEETYDGAVISVQLQIFTCSGTELELLYQEQGIVVGAGAECRYALYQGEESGSLYFYRSKPDNCWITSFETISATGEAALSSSQTLTRTTYVESGESTYELDGASIREETYQQLQEQYLDSGTRLLISSGTAGTEQTLLQLQTLPLQAMTLSQALAVLDPEAAAAPQASRMCDLEPAGLSSNFYLLDEAVSDTFGNTYGPENCYLAYAAAGVTGTTVEVEPDGQYRTLTLTVAVYERSFPKFGNLLIYDETGRVLYEQELYQNQEPQQLTLDISDVQTLTFRTDSSNSDGIWVILAEPVLEP